MTPADYFTQYISASLLKDRLRLARLIGQAARQMIAVIKPIFSRCLSSWLFQ